MILLITAPTTLGVGTEKNWRQTKWLLLLNIFEVSKLHLVLSQVEDLFSERSLACHRRCYIVLRHEGKTTVIVVWSYIGCFSPSHLSGFLRAVIREVEDNEFWSCCCAFWKKTENFLELAMHFPSNKVYLTAVDFRKAAEFIEPLRCQNPNHKILSSPELKTRQSFSNTLMLQ